MKKEFIKVIFDRKKRLDATGEGKVELSIYLGKSERKYITIRSCTAFAWKTYQKSTELKMHIAMYQQIIDMMVKNNDEMTVARLNHYLGLDISQRKEEQEKKKSLLSATGFIDFMREHISKEKLAGKSLARKKVTMSAMERFGRLLRFSDLTDKNVKAFDEFLREEAPRSQPTIHAYHKVIKMYTRLAHQLGYIETDPYDSPLCHFERGKYKERKPLTEEELMEIRNVKLPLKEGRVRDLFVFCAYTGLSYIDSQVFDFETMTQQLNGFTYIDGERVKTGNAFFTPILPPAMEVLKKYKFQLPHITNQKANDYLHLIEDRLKINKPLTTHVARHSFATLCLSYDIPIENVARMMGHSNIRTTQVYARILKKTIERHTEALIAKIQ